MNRPAVAGAAERSPHALSVDLEEYFQVSNFAQVIDRESWSELPSRVGDPTRRLLDRFDRHGHRATFFTLGWVGERQGPLLREIQQRGHEIACHGYGHDLVYDLGPEAFRRDLRQARSALEDAVGCRLRGYRAPSYSITRRSFWALEILAEEGFDYDSSIFPIRHPRYGVPGFRPEPMRLDLPGGRTIREFPPTTLALGPWRLPIAGGAYLRFLPGAVFRWGFRRAARPAMLYLHPWEIDPGQPRQDVGLPVRINHYTNLARVEDRLEALLQEDPFEGLGAVLDGLEASDRLPRIDLEDAAGIAPQATGAPGDRRRGYTAADRSASLE